MRNTALWICLIGSSFLAVQAMMVKNWGTDSYARRLAWSTKLLIGDSEGFLGLGMPEGMVLALGFTKNFTVTDPTKVARENEEYEASFRTFNSYFLDFYVNHTMLEPQHGKLRRFILNRAERLVHEKDDKSSHQHNTKGHQHELVTCDECISLEASTFQYGYTTYLKGLNLESWGVVSYGGPIRYVLTFQISLIVQYNKETKEKECISKLEEFKLRKEEGPLRMEATQGDSNFAFLADHIDEWTLNHLNTTVAEDFQEGMRAGIELIMSQRQMCKDFLTTGVFTDV